jgi:hypothetical protein
LWRFCCVWLWNEVKSRKFSKRPSVAISLHKLTFLLCFQGLAAKNVEYWSLWSTCLGTVWAHFVSIFKSSVAGVRKIQVRVQ